MFLAPRSCENSRMDRQPQSTISYPPSLVFTCSCPMEGKPGEGPEAMDVTFICPAIWPMLLVAILVAMETLLRFMPLLLYMLLLLCWVNCGDVCCCENILWRGEEHSVVKKCPHSLQSDTRGLTWPFVTCCLPCCLVASRSCQESLEKKRCLGPAASSETVCGPCVETAEGSVACPYRQSLRLPVGSYLPQTHRDSSATAQTQLHSKAPSAGKR